MPIRHPMVWLARAVLVAGLGHAGLASAAEQPAPGIAVLGAHGSASQMNAQVAAKARKETAGARTSTFTDFRNAGGRMGRHIRRYQTVKVICRIKGFKVQDGDTWWYRIASSPWDGKFYASADAFYNNGRTTGSLLHTPLVDRKVRICLK